MSRSCRLVFPAGSPACCPLVDERFGWLLANLPALEHGDWRLLVARDDDHSYENRLLGALGLREVAFEFAFCDNYSHGCSRFGPGAGLAVAAGLERVLAPDGQWTGGFAMSLDYAALPLRSLAPGARIRAATPHGGERPTLESRALRLMTDFAVVPAATVEPAMPLRDANQYMIRRGVRSLLVVDAVGRVEGIVTANDILGERPLQAALERAVRSAELAVREVMTPAERMEALPLESLLDARVGHVVATLQRAGRQHALVVERAGDGDVVRGVFSLTQIAAELGITLESAGVASTFAEIERALAH